MATLAKWSTTVQGKHPAGLWVAFTVLVAACGLIACNKGEPKPIPAVAPIEKVSPSPVGTSQTVLDKTFPLKATATYAFDIPAHAAMPHLHGMFESFTGQLKGGASDDSSNIDFLIMNQDQEAEFANNRPSDALFMVEASHNQAVNFDLPSSMDRPVKYYLVFRNPEGKKSAKLVEATFRVDF